MTEPEDEQLVREAVVKNATIIVRVPKGETNNLKKEIRHILDSTSHSPEKGELTYVGPDYKTQEVDRDEYVEVIVTGLECTIRMGESISEHNVGATCRWVLDCSTSVIAVGGFRLEDHYRVKK